MENTKPLLSAAIVLLIPAVLCTVGVLAITSNDTPEVVTHPYAPQTHSATYYDVTASPHFKWTHGVGGNLILGYLCFVVAAVYTYWVAKTLGVGTIAVIAVCWLGGAALMFAKYSFHYYEINTFEKAIDSTTYEMNKMDLDKLFEK